jgi:GntR family transcriptional regulator
MPEPRWRQIADDLRRKIESGEIGSDPAEPLPSEGELSTQYNASRNTIRSALSWLANLRLVEARPGQGTFVLKINPFVTTLSNEFGAGPRAERAAYASDGSRAYETEVAATNRTASATPPRIEISQAGTTDVAADQLGLPVTATVLSRHQRRFIDGEPWSLQTTFFPMDYVTKGAATDLLQAEDMPDGTVKYLEEKLGIKEAGWRDNIKVRAADDDETDFFGLPSDGRVGVFEIVRTGYDESGQPIRVTVTTCPVDRNEFVMIAGQVPMALPAQPVEQDS